eukprot:gb/GFBE01025307.1/.p1 GENE.gb/GFBE01025307.1/~~gb/GFBE01025307.1/.p1  ORF type:complete len:244 (+),score=26.59 gb/GFBE01025307.1/:1-732(+)
MSYTTMNRYGEVKHIYAPAATPYVRGIWWPDFGPMTTAFSDQPKMHPTNTIFQNQMVKHSKANKELLANPMGQGGQSEPQFRKPAPQTEALWSSTIIQPYKSGGHAKERMEGAWHSKAKASHDAHEEVQATLLAKRTMDKQTLSATVSPTRSMSSPSLGGAGCSLVGGASQMFSSGMLPDEASAPAWIARGTISSRPMDAAGLKGGSRSGLYKDGLSHAGLDPTSPTATILANNRSRSRLGQS